MTRCKRQLIGMMVALLALGVTSCATEPDPLDKTQPESVNKRVFEGEWYYKTTVVDTEWHNQYTFIGGEVQCVCPNPRCRFLNIIRITGDCHKSAS